MSFQIFYEDGHGNAVDEYGRPESMDYIIDEERYALETVIPHTQYLHNQPQEDYFNVASMVDEDAKDNVDICMKKATIKQAYTLYTDQDKVRFFKLMFEKVMSIHVRTAQRWAQMYKIDPASIFIKHKKIGRSRILHEEHKQVILEYRLLQKLQDLKASKSTVYNFVRTECSLSLKKAQFQPKKIQERFDWVHNWECTDVDFRTNCVFLNESAFHISFNRMPKARAQTTTT
ncbi:hypothetical protein BCV72DRAFT_248863 [Rhizopus microsporus var. microsporus]|uniref:Uncharacterized protein n=1 Tax=Rhizopus microsporus var. microsporus TaxID=86635 RepID=A0A1X0R8Z9_RHIZD|nr:hypothetical protein BCV72DRAFT_248863 [Rhizopus microsporus var. microsporus]